jgi:RimJ/RimL family protein N-acetyltransferase
MKSSDLQPTLIGERVLIRPVVAADWDGMYSVAADPEVWALHPASDRYREPVFREFFAGALSSGSALTILEREGDRIIGSSRYYGYEPKLREIEIGWTFMGRDYWGGSYNREIKHLMLAHAFSFVETVVFWVGIENYRSRRAMEKIGGVLREGVQRRSEADHQPHVVYEIRRTSFVRD